MKTTPTPRNMAIARARRIERAARHNRRRADLAGRPNLAEMYRAAGAAETRNYMRLRMVYATDIQS